jgi:hypothetical protein
MAEGDPALLRAEYDSRSAFQETVTRALAERYRDNPIELLTGSLADLFAETLYQFGWKIVCQHNARVWLLNENIEAAMPGQSKPKLVFTVIDGDKGDNA